MRDRLIAGPVVRDLLGPEGVDAWSRIVDTTPILCPGCGETIEPDSTEPLTLSAVFCLPDEEELPDPETMPPPPVRCFVAHQRCMPSDVIRAPLPPPDMYSLPAPPVLGLLRAKGTRAAVYFEPGGVLLDMSLRGGDPVNRHITTCLELGLHLVGTTFDDFDEPVVGWSASVMSGGSIEVVGPDGRTLGVDNAGLWPEWLAACAEDGACLLLTGSGVLGADVGVSDGSFTGREFMIRFDQARLDGRLVGGVVPATVDASLLPAAEQERPLDVAPEESQAAPEAPQPEAEPGEGPRRRRWRRRGRP